MGRKIIKHIKYTKKELNKYVKDKNSCIEIINNKKHISFPPSGIGNFEESLKNLLSKNVGSYDPILNGIILEIKNIKVLCDQWEIRNDHSDLHLNVNGDFFIFKPNIGSIIKGIVKHVTQEFIAVVIYRVFHVSIYIDNIDIKNNIKLNDEIAFKIKKFDLRNRIPYIEGEYINKKLSNPIETNVNVKKIFNNSDDNLDSGISTEENLTKKNIKIKNEIKKESSDSSSEESDKDIIKEVKLEKTKKASSSSSSSDNSDENYFLKNKSLTKKIKKETIQRDASSKSSSSSSSSSNSETNDKRKILTKKNDLKKINKNDEKKKSSSSSDSDTDDDNYSTVKATNLPVKKLNLSGKKTTENVREKSSSDTDLNETQSNKLNKSTSIKKEKELSKSSTNSSDSDSESELSEKTTKKRSKKLVKTKSSPKNIGSHKIDGNFVSKLPLTKENTFESNSDEEEISCGQPIKAEKKSNYQENNESSSSDSSSSSQETTKNVINKEKNKEKRKSSSSSSSDSDSNDKIYKKSPVVSEKSDSNSEPKKDTTQKSPIKIEKSKKMVSSESNSDSSVSEPTNKKSKLIKRTPVIKNNNKTGNESDSSDVSSTAKVRKIVSFKEELLTEMENDLSLSDSENERIPSPTLSLFKTPVKCGKNNLNRKKKCSEKAKEIQSSAGSKVKSPTKLIVSNKSSSDDVFNEKTQEKMKKVISPIKTRDLNPSKSSGLDSLKTLDLSIIKKPDTFLPPKIPQMKKISKNKTTRLTDKSSKNTSIEEKADIHIDRNKYIIRTRTESFTDSDLGLEESFDNSLKKPKKKNIRKNSLQDKILELINSQIGKSEDNEKETTNNDSEKIEKNKKTKKNNVETMKTTDSTILKKRKKSGRKSLNDLIKSMINGNGEGTTDDEKPQKKKKKEMDKEKHSIDQLPENSLFEPPTLSSTLKPHKKHKSDRRKSLDF